MKKLKVGLLSYEFWYNYGTCFQAYALWKVLEKLNLNAEYYDFGWRYPMPPFAYLTMHAKYKRNKISLRMFARYWLSKLKAVIRRRALCPIKYDIVTIRNNRRFDTFRSKYLRIAKQRTEKEANLYYDYFIVGSDQTWNPNCVEEKWFKNFLLDFVTDDNKKLCYAPSVGMTSIDAKTRCLFKQYLSSFRSLSCREERGCALIVEATGRDVTAVLDPTFLLTPDEWRAVSCKIKTPCTYVLCYILGEKECVVEYARKLANARAAKLLIISTHPSIVSKFRDNIISGVGPSEFVSLLDKADAVVTDSFHGTAFAINFNKPMHAFVKRNGGISESDNSRIGDVLSKFKLSDRFCNDDAPINLNTCDFSQANDILAMEREKSWSYLKTMLNYREPTL